MKKKNIRLEIIPSYKCNLQCQFCEEWNKFDGTLLDFDILKKNIYNLISVNNIDIDSVIILGGEPSLLPVQYYKSLLNVLYKYNLTNIMVFTNGSNMDKMNEFREQCKIIISTDIGIRKNFPTVLKYLLQSTHQETLNMMFTNLLVKNLKLFKKVASLKNVTISFTPYNKTVKSELDYPEYDDFIFFINEIYDFIKRGKVVFKQSLYDGASLEVECLPNGEMNQYFNDAVDKQIYKVASTGVLKDVDYEYSPCKTCKFHGSCFQYYINNHICDKDFAINNLLLEYYHSMNVR